MIKHKYTDYVENYINKKNNQSQYEFIVSVDLNFDGNSIEPTEREYPTMNPIMNTTMNPKMNPTNINSNNNIIFIVFFTIGPILLLIILLKFRRCKLLYNYFRKKTNIQNSNIDQFGLEIQHICDDIENCGRLHVPT